MMFPGTGSNSDYNFIKRRVVKQLKTWRDFNENCCITKNQLFIKEWIFLKENILLVFHNLIVSFKKIFKLYCIGGKKKIAINSKRT